MLLILFYDGNTSEIAECEDVIHEAGCIICLDHCGASLASFLHDEIAGYTLHPAIIREIKSDSSG